MVVGDISYADYIGSLAYPDNCQQLMQAFKKNSKVSVAFSWVRVSMWVLLGSGFPYGFFLGQGFHVASSWDRVSMWLLLGSGFPCGFFVGQGFHVASSWVRVSLESVFVVPIQW